MPINNSADHQVTQYNLITGGANNVLNNVSPSATSGVPVISQGSSAQPIFGTAVVGGGGTGNTTFPAYSVICAGTTATAAFQNVSGLGSSGNVLTSNGAGTLPTWQAAASSGITTINGDNGSVTGSTISFKSAATAGSSTFFSGSGTAMTFNLTDSNSNTILGDVNAGNASISGTYNVGHGASCLHSLTSGAGNTCIGRDSGYYITTGNYNTCIGYDTQFSSSFTSGSYNSLFGYNAGINYNGTESSNILLNNSGTAAESNVLRIGSATGTGNQQINKSFIYGIAGVTASNPSVVTINTSTSQLGNDTTNFTILSTGLQLKGNNTNTAPPAGMIGEQIRSSNSSGTSVGNNTATNIANISLTAGIWDISSVCQSTFSGAVSRVQSAISANSASLTGTVLGDSLINTAVSGNAMSTTFNRFRHFG